MSAAPPPAAGARGGSARRGKPAWMLFQQLRQQQQDRTRHGMPHPFPARNPPLPLPPPLPLVGGLLPPPHWNTGPMSQGAARQPQPGTWKPPERAMPVQAVHRHDLQHGPRSPRGPWQDGVNPPPDVGPFFNPHRGTLILGGRARGSRGKAHGRKKAGRVAVESKQQGNVVSGVKRKKEGEGEYGAVDLVFGGTEEEVGEKRRKGSDGGEGVENKADGKHQEYGNGEGGEALKKQEAIAKGHDGRDVLGGQGRDPLEEESELHQVDVSRDSCMALGSMDAGRDGEQLQVDRIGGGEGGKGLVLSCLLCNAVVPRVNWGEHVAGKKHKKEEMKGLDHAEENGIAEEEKEERMESLEKPSLEKRASEKQSLERHHGDMQGFEKLDLDILGGQILEKQCLIDKVSAEQGSAGGGSLEAAIAAALRGLKKTTEGTETAVGMAASGREEPSDARFVSVAAHSSMADLEGRGVARVEGNDSAAAALAAVVRVHDAADSMSNAGWPAAAGSIEEVVGTKEDEEEKDQDARSLRLSQGSLRVSRFKCDLCRVDCMTAGSLKSHLNGKRHKKATAKNHERVVRQEKAKKSEEASEPRLNEGMLMQGTEEVDVGELTLTEQVRAFNRRLFDIIARHQEEFGRRPSDPDVKSLHWLHDDALQDYWP